MIVKVNKKFLKDLAVLPAQERRKIENLVFEESPQFSTLESTGIFEKLKGYPFYFRARFGNYRVGVKYENDTLTFERVLHRKEIYRYFP